MDYAKLHDLKHTLELAERNLRYAKTKSLTEYVCEVSTDLFYDGRAHVEKALEQVRFAIKEIEEHAERQRQECEERELQERAREEELEDYWHAKRESDSSPF